MWHCNERRSQAARTWRPADPAGPRFAAQRDGVSGRFRSSPTARYRPPGRGHACRSAVRCGARRRRDADRGAFPRAYIDPNRHRSDIDPELLADAWTEPIAPSRKTELGIGLVWRLAHGGVPMYARKLAAAEVRRRITDFYDPYHARVSAALDRRHAAFGAVWHINCHSMPAVGDVMSEDPGRARADFVLGDRDGSTCAPEFTAFVARTLTGLGYDVAINDPYKAVELVRMHGRPAERRHSLQVEINRRLYMDESTLARHSGFATLQSNLERLLHSLR